MTRASKLALVIACLLAGVACSESAPDPAPIPTFYDGNNRALSFDGANDYATTGSAAFPVADHAQTLTAWVRPARVTALEVADAGSVTEDLQAVLVLRKDLESGVVLGMRRGAFEAWSVYSGRTYVRASAPVIVGVWQHIGYSFDGTIHRIFVGGRQLDASTLAPNNRTPTSGWLGTIDGSHDLFVGELDDVCVYKVALDPSAISGQAARGRTTALPSESPAELVLWLGFDEVAGHRVFDHSGRGNDALLGDGITERMPERLIER